MSFTNRVAAGVAAALVLAAPLAGQEKAVVLQGLGGGYSHLANLNAAGNADFKTGFNLGAVVGVQLTKFVSVHGDFTFARNQARGSAPFAGSNFNRFFYGAHLELRYPFEGGLAPFVFAGGGGVTVDQSATGGLNFTKAAGMFGAGASYSIPRSKVELLFEGKTLVYKWDQGGFNKTQADLTYSVGLAYRIGF